MLGAHFNVEFIAMLIAGCALMAFIALAVEHRIPDRANGITTAVAGLSRARSPTGPQTPGLAQGRAGRRRS
jgi:hypothetical protein